MAKYVTQSELLTHAPEVRDNVIVGCMGWTWRAAFWAHAGPQWTQYLNHLPTFSVEGFLILSDRDEKLLQEMNAAFQKAPRKFEDPE